MENKLRERAQDFASNKTWIIRLLLLVKKEFRRVTQLWTGIREINLSVPNTNYWEITLPRATKNRLEALRVSQSLGKTNWTTTIMVSKAKWPRKSQAWRRGSFRDAAVGILKRTQRSKIFSKNLMRYPKGSPMKTRSNSIIRSHLSLEKCTT